MHQPARPNALPACDEPLRNAIVADLARPRKIHDYAEPVVTLVVAIRLMAAAMQGNCDPLVELTRRLGSITAAKAVLDLAKAGSQAWPENVMVNRPCCHALSPDEAVLADMASAVLAGDRQQFAAVLEGLVRRERHERLYGAAAAVMAELA
ncbi:DNA-directed RNA polymerase subunit beta' [Aurantiacibacter sp. MUD11]|uniref:DNA-directed RNA polymerase subunit beta' n=1 Tax=Aurantiacibacter sp. MUD11 TaxID=3003265 RepID=UPI0022AA980D|nr:DNA-directed RNA polymerase subunit beta' [Aurantiacibacter sp. MUD11]WAT17401.1 DNA-directed RNA polymerase subunit beta' [Aurantiacibacter sp. MUD11]